MTTRILPSLLRMIAATASGWMTRSCSSRPTSSMADIAVVSSRYPIAIRSAIPHLLSPSTPLADSGTFIECRRRATRIAPMG